MKEVLVNDKMQQGYRYVLTAPVGRDFDREFRPELTPGQMLALGVFGGKYMTDCRDLGRRMPEEDARQIGRWRALQRHVAQVRRNCAVGDLSCRQRQRQALLHWAYDLRNL